MNPSLLFHLGLIAYTAAAGAYLTFLIGQGERAARIGTWATSVGFAFHGVAVALQGVAWLRDGALRFSEALSILAFLTIGAFLVIHRRYRAPVMGAFITPLVVAVLAPAHAIPGVEVALPGPMMSVVLPLHIAVSLGGLAFFALGFGVATMYLLLERQLKTKRFGRLFRSLPPLELLDSLNYRLVAWGFVCLSVTVATGALFSKLESGPLLRTDPKQTFSLIAWGLAAAVIGTRKTVGWRGRRMAVATMVGFFLVSFAFVGIFLGGGV